MNTLLASVVTIFSLLGCTSKDSTSEKVAAPQSQYKEALDNANAVSALSNARDSRVAKQGEEEDEGDIDDSSDDMGSEGDEE